MRDFVQKVSFYYFGRGRHLWALNPQDWRRKKEKSADVFGSYPVPERQGADQVIVYLLPGTWIAGGIAVALRHANMLLAQGYRVYIVTQDLKTAFPWFPSQKAEVIPISRIEGLLNEGIDILIATGWNSAPTADLLPARRKVYLVQLDERRFYEDESTKQFVGETYRLSFEYVVIAQWMKRWLKDEFGHNARYIPNGLDEAYFQEAKALAPKSAKPRILIEGPIDVPFKGVERSYEAVSGLGAELWIVSGRGTPPASWKYDKFLSQVPADQMPRVYRSCDILLKMSTVESFCYPPLEMMASGGVPVILAVSGIEEYAVHDHNCLIVTNDTEARAAVKRLMEDRELFVRLSRNGLATAKQWRWERAAAELKNLVTEPQPDTDNELLKSSNP